MRLLFLPILFAFCLSASAQTKSIQNSPPLSEGTPRSVGMSEERLARVDSMIKESVTEGQIPGAVALVARHGKIVLMEAYGMADYAGEKAMETDTIFRIASQSKAVTATAVLMLWEEGKFRLDDPVFKYIPEFENPQVLKSYRYQDGSYTTEPATQEITIRHLLTHTSGLGYGVIDKDERFQLIYEKAGIIDLFTTEDISIADNVKKLAALPLHHNPGEKYTYSEGFDVLGYFVEVISGMPFDAFLNERLFQPLGMTDTGFYLPDEKADRLVKVQKKSEEGQLEWVHYPVTFYDTEYPITGEKRFFSGGAGLCSTAKDYATFLQMLLNNGELNGVRILSRTTIQMMMGNQTPGLYDDPRGLHHGLGIGVLDQKAQDLGGRGSAGTFYWGGYFNTQGFGDPKEGIVAVIMKQTQGPVNDETGWKFPILVEQSVDD